MAQFTLNWNVRLSKVATPRHVRRSLYSVGRWFGGYAPRATDVPDDADRFGHGRAVDMHYPFVRVDLVTGADSRPPAVLHNNVIRGGIVRGGDDPSFEPAVDHLPGVEEVRSSSGRLLGLRDTTLTGRAGRGFSWAHITALQSQDATWGEEQPLWSSSPNLEFLLEGMRVAQPKRNNLGDTQLSAAAFSTNAALIRAWLLITRKGVSMANIDVDALRESIQICNQSYTTFLPTGALRGPLSIQDVDYGGWALDPDGTYTIALPGRTAGTNISAVAQDPANPRSYALISSGDNKIWYINRSGAAEVFDTFPALPQGVSELHFRGGATILSDGTLVAYVVSGTRTASDTAPDGYTYPAITATTRRYLYVRKVRDHAAETPRPNFPGVTLDNVGDHAYIPVGYPGAQGRGNIAIPAGFYLRKDLLWLDDDFVDNTDENDLVAVGFQFTGTTSPYYWGGSQVSGAGAPSSWRHQIIQYPPTGTTTPPDTERALPPLVLDDGLHHWWMRDEGAILVYQSPRRHSSNRAIELDNLTVPAQSPDDTNRYAGVLRSALNDRLLLVRRDGETIDTLLRVSNIEEIVYQRVPIPGSVPPRPRLVGYGVTGWHVSVDLSEIPIQEDDVVTYLWERTPTLDPLDVSPAVTPNDEATYALRANNHYRVAVTVTPTEGAATTYRSWWTGRIPPTAPEAVPAPIELDPIPRLVTDLEDRQNKLVIVALNRPYEEGGYRQLGYLLPRSWTDVDATALSAGQARRFEGSVYWCVQDLPAGYWDSPPSSPETPLWKRIEGDRHVFLSERIGPDYTRRCSIFSRRYEAHGEIYTDSDMAQVEASLDDAMLGHVVYSNGKYFIHAGRGERWTATGTTPKEPVATITDEDLVGNGITVVQASPPQQDVTNYLTCAMQQDQTDNWHPSTALLRDPYKAARQGRDEEGRLDLRFVTNPIQAHLIGNALLMEEREPMRIDLTVSPRLPPSDLEYSLARLHPGDVLRCDFSLLGPGERDMIVERTSVDPRTFEVNLTLAVQLKGHTDLFFYVPPYPPTVDTRPRGSEHPLSEFSLGAGSIADIDEPGTPTEAGAPVVCGAGMSIDRRFTFVATNPTDRQPARILVFDNYTDKVGALSNASYWTGGGGTPAIPAVAGSPAVPERAAETAFEYTLTDDDVGNTMQVRVFWTDDNGIERILNGWRSIVIGAAGGTNNRTGSFNGVTQSGNFVSGETINVTIDRSFRADWGDSRELRPRVIRRAPGQSISAATEVHFSTLLPYQAGQAAVPAQDAVPATYRSGLGVVGFQGDPSYQVQGGYAFGNSINSFTVPPHADGLTDRNEPKGAVFVSGSATIDAISWFEDYDGPNEPDSQWGLWPGLRFKLDHDRGTLGPTHENTRYDQRFETVGWDARAEADGGTGYMVFSQEGISGPGPTPEPGTGRLTPISLFDLITDPPSPWGGRVFFEGEQPVRSNYTAILDDSLYSYWLRTDGSVEVRATLYLWDRQEHLARREDLDVPVGLITPGDSIAIQHAQGDTIRLVAFKADGTGYYSLSNSSGEWQVITRPV